MKSSDSLPKDNYGEFPHANTTYFSFQKYLHFQETEHLNFHKCLPWINLSVTAFKVNKLLVIKNAASIIRSSFTLCSIDHDEQTQCPRVLEPQEEQESQKCHDVIDIDNLKSTPLPSYWLPDLELEEEDKEILLSGQWLTDKHISAINTLLLKEYPEQNGLRNTVVLFEGLPWKSKADNFVQVINVSRNHWVCAANIGCPENIVNVYDSIPAYSIDSPSLKRQLAAILRTQAPSFEVNFINVQRQIGSSDCGLFAIANAVSLCLGNDPHMLRYDQKQMRNHLYNCFENHSITPFPMKMIPARANRQRISTVRTVEVYCSCRQPYNAGKDHMIQCHACSEWFHDTCYPHIPSEFWTTNKTWICTGCAKPITSRVQDCYYCYINPQGSMSFICLQSHQNV